MADHPAHDLPTDYCPDVLCGGFTKVVEAADVTDEVLDIAETYAEGFYPEGRIDWEDLFDRIDGLSLNDNSRVDLGNEYGSPAMRKIQREVRKRMQEG